MIESIFLDRNMTVKYLFIVLLSSLITCKNPYSFHSRKELLTYVDKQVAQENVKIRSFRLSGRLKDSDGMELDSLYFFKERNGFPKILFVWNSRKIPVNRFELYYKQSNEWKLAGQDSDTSATRRIILLTDIDGDLDSTLEILIFKRYPAGTWSGTNMNAYRFESNDVPHLQQIKVIDSLKANLTFNRGKRLIYQLQQSYTEYILTTYQWVGKDVLEPCYKDSTTFEDDNPMYNGVTYYFTWDKSLQKWKMIPRKKGLLKYRFENLFYHDFQRLVDGECYPCSYTFY